MPYLRKSSSDMNADLEKIDHRLQRLQEAEEGITTNDAVDGSVISEQFSPSDGGSTLQGTASPSGCTTPWEAQVNESRPPVRPRLHSFGHSSMIQVKKEEVKTWYRYPRDGYKLTTKYFYEELDSSWTAVMLVACFFVSGLVDAVSFGVWSVFVAMQTGNTIFLALRISNQPESHHPLNYVKSLVSLGSYCIGALVFNCLHRAPSGLGNAQQPLRRWTLVTSFIIQSTLLVVVAILAQLQIISAVPYQGGSFSSGTPISPGDNYYDLVGIGLLALEAAGQVCLSRVLVVNELPTIVLSTLYHDLIGEGLSTLTSWRESTSKWDFAVRQKKQIRRITCILSLFIGALVGGFVFRGPAGLQGALWIAAAVKLGICCAWCFWKRKSVVETVVTRGK